MSDDARSLPPPAGEGGRKATGGDGLEQRPTDPSPPRPALPTPSSLRSDDPPPQGEGKNVIDLSHINAWVFDLDDTLYPPEQGVMALVQARINAFMVDAVGLPADQALVLQKSFLNEHGTTLAGLMANYSVDPERFLREVHDVPLDSLEPNPQLVEVIARLPGRKYVLTNGARYHAERVLARIGLAQMDGVYCIEDMDLTPKPAPSTYRRFLDGFDIDASRAVFFEDTPRNLQPAKALGMTTVLIGPSDKDGGRGLPTGDWIDVTGDNLLDFLTPYSMKAAA